MRRWEALRLLARSNLFFLCKGILGFNDLDPHFHGPLCFQLDKIRLPYGRRLDLWPRGHLKTHIITIGKSIQDYLCNNNVRILLAASNLRNATKNLSAIKRQFETNVMLRWLFPECVPDSSYAKWAEMEICLPRPKNYPEPTFKAVGVGAHIAGWHFDIIRKDDLIDEKTEKSPEVMEKIIDWHLLSKNLFESPSVGVDHLIGTRWSMGDLYQFIINNEKEYEHLTVSALKPAPGGSKMWVASWPERFDAKALLTLREKDPYMFACQQMNNPKDEAIAAFRAEWLRYFAWADADLNLMIEAP